MSDNLKTPIDNSIEKLKVGEKTVREALSFLSRNLILYVNETNDIDAVNRTIAVVTPMNKQMAIKFFTHMLPWTVEKDEAGNFSRFGGAIKGLKNSKRKFDNGMTFLENPDSDIWSWAKENIEVELKAGDVVTPLMTALENAINGKKATKTREAALPISAETIMQLVFKSGANPLDLMDALDKIEVPDVDEDGNIIPAF